GTSPVGFACACMALLHPERLDDVAQLRATFAGEFG
ncbi:glutamine amidotransferase, partial [Xanthomonas sp. Kuri4-3]